MLRTLRNTRAAAPVRLVYRMHDRPSEFRFELAGPLAGREIAELERCWQAASSTVRDRKFVVDVAAVTSVDGIGKELLERWQAEGAQIVNRTTAVPDPPMAQRVGAMVASLLLASLFPPAAAGATVASGVSPEIVLERYASAVDQGRSVMQCQRTKSSVEASTKLRERPGPMELIRRLIPLDKIQEVHVDEVPGGPRHAIARYLPGAGHLAILRALSEGLMPARYRFRYTGSVGAGANLAYVYSVSPKRDGVLAGEIWIDVNTGLAVRQASAAVKDSPEFPRGARISQDMLLRDGTPYVRITRVTIDTSTGGRAGLSIEERACEVQTGLLAYGSR